MRRATVWSPQARARKRDFYPRSPCGERPYGRINDISRLIFLSTLSLRRATTIFAVRPYDAPIFLSTLSLRRATTQMQAAFKGPEISIHALLAESDICDHLLNIPAGNFYPRSPCGERLAYRVQLGSMVSISIHALLAESDPWNPGRTGRCARFLSTLSLRRATGSNQTIISQADDFYPRSPCGERLCECWTAPNRL